MKPPTPGGPSPPEEKRLHPRAAIELEARYRLEGQEGWRTGAIRNLSAGGMALASAEPLAEGSLVAPIVFSLPDDGESIRAAAFVLRCQPEPEVDGSHVAGLHFLDLDGPSFERIRLFVFRRLRGDG